MFDKIKHVRVCIVLVLPTKSVFKHAIHNIHR